MTGTRTSPTGLAEFQSGESMLELQKRGRNGVSHFRNVIEAASVIFVLVAIPAMLGVLVATGISGFGNVIIKQPDRFVPTLPNSRSLQVSCVYSKSVNESHIRQFL